jgi:uncharacterized protein
MAQTKGQFCWVELMTKDPQAAIDFYREVTGWTSQPFSEDYTVFKAGDQMVAGAMKLPPEAEAAGAPPHWMAYVVVDSVESTREQAKRLGGQVYVEPTDIPQVGRFAVLADPQGASFALLKPETQGNHTGGKAPGHAWHELGTTDYQAGFDFYAQLFGWKELNQHEMGPGMTYLVFGDESGNIGGMYTMPPDMPAPPHWLHYIQVDKTDAAIERIKANGGKIVNGPMDVPGGGRIAVAGDPQGAMFAVFSM